MRAPGFPLVENLLLFTAMPATGAGLPWAHGIRRRDWFPRLERIADIWGGSFDLDIRKLLNENRRLSLQNPGAQYLRHAFALRTEGPRRTDAIFSAASSSGLGLI